MRTGYKWIPVVDQDWCNGCAQCVESCDHGCLQMVWAFAALARPEDCGSEGTCIAACPQDAIHMEWRPVAGDRARGEWRDDPPEAPPGPSILNAWALIRRAFS